MRIAAAAGAIALAVDGLRRRLVLTRADSEGRPQLRIDLDLENQREALAIEILRDEPPLS